MMPIGAWCEFCQIAHFSDNCLHPGRKLLNAIKAERDEWRKKAAAEQRKVWQLEQDCQHWQERALEAEASLNAQGQIPRVEIKINPDVIKTLLASDPDEPVAGTA